jgi:[histone H3]-lysine9 N-trimethyltransferase SUV39H
VNQVDDEVLPKDFRFIKEIQLGEGVQPAEDSFRSGCSCGNDGAGCQFASCHCLADLDEGDDDEAGASQKKAYSYHTHGHKAGLLRSNFLDSAFPLYECHQACSCSARCPNRVVERGRTVPLEIFRTGNRGWGA